MVLVLQYEFDHRTWRLGLFLCSAPPHLITHVKNLTRHCTAACCARPRTIIQTETRPRLALVSARATVAWPSKKYSLARCPHGRPISSRGLFTRPHDTPAQRPEPDANAHLPFQPRPPAHDRPRAWCARTHAYTHARRRPSQPLRSRAHGHKPKLPSPAPPPLPTPHEYPTQPPAPLWRAVRGG